VWNFHKLEASIVIPYKDRPGRAPLLEFVYAWACVRFAEVIVANAGPADGGTFNKSRLINQGMQQATKNVLGYLDADCVVGDAELNNAVLTASHNLRLVYPHKRFIRLTEEETTRILQTCDPHNDMTLTQVLPRRKPTTPGGFVLFQREIYDNIQMDEDYTEWGAEDNDFRDRSRAMFGKEIRMENTLMLHLWHPPNNNRPPENITRYHQKRAALFSTYELPRPNN